MDFHHYDPLHSGENPKFDLSHLFNSLFFFRVFVGGVMGKVGYGIGKDRYISCEISL